MRKIILPAVLCFGVGLVVMPFFILPSQFLPGLLISFALLLIVSFWTGSVKNQHGIPYVKSPLIVRFFFAILIAEIMIHFYPTRDAAGYNTDGFQAMLMLKAGDIDEFFRAGFLGGAGTTFYKKMTGVMFLLFGPNEITVRVINTTIAWLGALFFFSAFSWGMGLRQKKAFAFLLFFTPSILLWTSIHGKDPWVFFGIGVFSWASIRVLKGTLPNLFELALVALAVAIIYFIRPHIDMLLAGSLLVAAIFSRSSHEKVRRFIPFMSSLFLFYFAYATFVSWVGVETGGSFQSLVQVGYEHQEQIIEAGGSSYDIPAGLRPFLVLVAPIFVYLRPFPFEVRNVFALYTSAESLILFVLLAIGLRRLLKHPWQRIRDPITVFSLSYLLAFSLLFVFSGNSGLLARQKAVQALPFLCFLASFAFCPKKEEDHENP